MSTSATVIPHPPIASEPAALAVTSQLGGDYERCGCLGVLPGRACIRCNNTKWLRKCTECNGSGRTFVNARQSSSQPRGEIHGRCGGRGWLPCRLSEVADAVATAADSASATGKTAKK